MSHNTVYSVRPELLSENNYDTWKIQMEALLKEKDTWGYVSGEKPRPIVSTDPSTREASQAAYDEWIIGDREVKKDIILLISPLVCKQIQVWGGTSKELWDELETIYVSKFERKKAKLHVESLLTRLMRKMPEYGNVTNHLNDLFDVVDELQSMNVEINVDMLSIIILHSLPSSFDTFRCAIESLDDLPDAETLKVKIIEESEARKQKTSDRESCAVNHQSSSQQETVSSILNPFYSYDEKQLICGPGILFCGYYDFSRDPHNEIWEPNIYDEVKILIANDTWELVERPTNSNIVGCRTILYKKYIITTIDPNGEVVKRKARVVVDRFLQSFGYYFHYTHPFTANEISFRLLFALSAELGMTISQLDITDSYLYGDMDSTVYMETPQFLEEMLIRIVCKESNGELREKAAAMLLQFRQGRRVCLLKKRLYGLPESLDNVRFKLCEIFKNIGLSPLNINSFVYVNKEKTVFLLVFYDNILIASKDPAMTKNITDMLKKKITFENLGEAKYCENIEIVKNSEYICLSQEGYIKHLLFIYGDIFCNTASTPMDSYINLTNVVPQGSDNSIKYMWLMKSLTYVAIKTRPDIAYVVRLLNRLNCKHEEKHWKVAINVLRYLKNTAGFALCFKRTKKDLLGYVNINWNNCPIDGRYHEGNVCLLAGAAIFWEQSTHSLSSSAFNAINIDELNVGTRIEYFMNFLQQLGIDTLTKAIIFNSIKEESDNITVCHNITYHQSYIHLPFVSDRSQSSIKSVPVKYLPTEQMIADIFTKALPKGKHEFCVRELGLMNIEN